MKLEKVQINEILGFLDAHAPEELELLKKDFPELAAEINAGFIAGGDEKKTSPENKRNRLKVRSAVISLTDIVERCEERLPELTGQLRSGRKIRFTAEILAIVGGASIWGVLRTNFFLAAEILAASLTLLGAILAVVGWYFSTTPEDERVLEVRGELIAVKVEAKMLLDELKLYKNALTNDEFEIVAPSVARANKLCGEAWKLLERVRDSA